MGSPYGILHKISQTFPAQGAGPEGLPGEGGLLTMGNCLLHASSLPCTAQRAAGWGEASSSLPSTVTSTLPHHSPKKFRKKHHKSRNIHFQRVPNFVTPLPWVEVSQMQTKPGAFLFWGLCLPNWEGENFFHSNTYLALWNIYI